MKRLGLLKANRYPYLRWRLFCGEPLTKDLVENWAMAAPNSIIENLYGPTELTIACTLYRLGLENIACRMLFGYGAQCYRSRSLTIASICIRRDTLELRSNN